MSKASEFLRDLVLFMPESWQGPNSKHGPGQVIEKKVSPENRELLKTLKSEDLENERPDANMFYSKPKRKGRWGLEKCNEQR